VTGWRGGRRRTARRRAALVGAAARGRRRRLRRFAALGGLPVMLGRRLASSTCARRRGGRSRGVAPRGVRRAFSPFRPALLASRGLDRPGRTRGRLRRAGSGRVACRNKLPLRRGDDGRLRLRTRPWSSRGRRTGWRRGTDGWNGHAAGKELGRKQRVRRGRGRRAEGAFLGHRLWQHELGDRPLVRAGDRELARSKRFPDAEGVEPELDRGRGAGTDDGHVSGC
jgi:hypothetical protein